LYEQGTAHTSAEHIANIICKPAKLQVKYLLTGEVSKGIKIHQEEGREGNRKAIIIHQIKPSTMLNHLETRKERVTRLTNQAIADKQTSKYFQGLYLLREIDERITQQFNQRTFFLTNLKKSA